MTTSGDGLGGSGSVAAAQLTHEIEALANEMFKAPPGPLPAATAVGAGGASPLVAIQPAVQLAPSPAMVPSPQPGGVPAFAPEVEGAPGVLDLGARPDVTPFDQGPSVGGAPDAPLRTPTHAEPPYANPFTSPISLGGVPGAVTPATEIDGLDTALVSAPSTDLPAQHQPYYLDIAAPKQTPATDAPHPPEAARAREIDPSSFSTSLDPVVTPTLAVKPDMFDAHAVKRDFPILQENIRGEQLVWLDNGATTQKPNAVIERVRHFYRHENSNVHRGAHTLAARATDAYEGARSTVKRFLNASSPEEIVFVRGATEGINLVAKSWGARNVRAGDEIVITHLEHHANIVPWQMLCAEKGAKLKVAPVDSTGQVILEEYEKLFTDRTKLAAFTQVSNALGTITPVKEMIDIAHRWGACVLVDGAQAVSHMPVDVQWLDCELFVFSGHKIFAPTGIGVVYGKKDVLAHMPPWQGGGNMIADVTFEKTVYQPPPWRFEAGTGNIADAVGLGAALDYVSALGLPNIARHEHELRVYAEECLRAIRGLTIIGTAADKAGVISFVLDGVRTEDVGGMLDLEGIAVRSGHHCAQPILRRFGLEATVRASLAPYNTREDIDRLVAAVERLQLQRSGV